MMAKCAKFFNWNRSFISALIFIFFFSAGVTLAVPPGTKYGPGETLDPSCTPGSTNCSVQIIPDQTGHGGEFLTTDGTTLSWATAGGSGTSFVQNGNSFGGTAILGTNDTNNLAFETDGVTRMQISTAGDVGIGVPADDFTLEIRGSIGPNEGSSWDIGAPTRRFLNMYGAVGDFSSQLNVASGVSGGGQGLLHVGAGANQSYSGSQTTAMFQEYGLTDLSLYDAANNSELYLYNEGTIGAGIGTNTATPLYLGTNAGTALTIDVNNNVGIGTGILGDKFQVEGSAFFGESLGSEAGVAVGYNNSDPNDVLSFILGKGGNSSGIGIRNFLVGFNDTLGDSSALSILGPGTSPIIFGNYLGGSEYMRLDINGNIGIANTSPLVKLHIGDSAITDGTTLLRLEDINSTCNFTANSGSPSCGSDRRLKKDISSLDTSNLLVRINALNPVSYRWKTESDDADLQYGFIAQEVEEQFPDLVSESDWVDGSRKKFLNTGGLVPYLVGAVKELNIKIEALPHVDQSFSGTMGVFFDTVLLGVENGVAKITALVTGTLEVGSSEKPTGVTLYDEATGEPYCLSIKNGEEKVKAGACEVVEKDTQEENNNQPNEDTPEDTPGDDINIEEPPVSNEEGTVVENPIEETETPTETTLEDTTEESQPEEVINQPQNSEESSTPETP